MNTRQSYNKLDMVQLFSGSPTVHLDNEFILIDNFNESPEEAEKDWEFVNHPVKFSFSIAFFCVSGRIRVRLNLQNFELHRNDLLIVLENSIGEYLGMDEETQIAVIAFSSEYFQTALQIEATMSLQRRLYSSPLCHLNDKAMEESLAIYRLMKDKIKETDNPFRKGALLGYTQVLTYNAYKYLLDSDKDKDMPEEKSSRKEELYNMFISEVQKNYTKERSISWYADKLCVTPKYLSRVVHQVSGRFSGDWISDFVILEAKAMLKSRRYSIQQIAASLNFANQSFFGRYFKDKVGCSPSEYQKS